MVKENVMAVAMVKPGSLDKLAKLLASENIMIEHRPIKTAHFDMKNRVLALPMWQEMTESLYHMLVLHEIGHALETPLDAWKEALDNTEKEDDSSNPARVSKIFQGYMNVVEDARIERKVKIKFPGSRRDFVEGYDWLHNNDFFQIKNDNIDNLSLIDRINLYFKIGTKIRIKFTEEERAFVTRAETTITFDDVVALSRDLFAYVKDKKQDDMDEQAKNMLAELESEDGEETDHESDDDDGDSDPEENGEDSDVEASDSNPAIDKSVNIDEAKTDTAMNDRMEELLDPSLSDREFKYITFPKDISYENFLYDYRAVLEMIHTSFSESPNPNEALAYRNFLLNKFRIHNNNAINYMVKEFEMKKAAISYSRSKQARTGTIDTNKIHSYKFNDDIFRRLTIEPSGKNHGIVCYLDMSGSMGQNFLGAMDQLICLAMFCRRVGIPHRFYGFTSVMSQFTNHRRNIKNADKDRIMRRLNNKPFVYPELEFDLIEMFHEKMSLKEFNTMTGALLYAATIQNYGVPDDYTSKKGYGTASSYAIDMIGYNSRMRYFELGSTPLNSALLVSRDLLRKFRKEKNIQILNFVCITDGESDPATYVSPIEIFPGQIKGVEKSFPYNTAKLSKVSNIFVDEESRMQTTVAFGGSFDITGMYARIIRESQDINFIGFYITSSTYEIRSALYRYASASYNYDTFITKFRKEGSVVVPNMLNFSEFYMIQGGKKLQAQQTNLGSSHELTKNQLAKAFIGAQNKRGASRVVLSRFIEKIAV
jgi:hypothetical protein